MPSHPNTTPPLAAQLRPGEFFVSLGSATLAPHSSASLTRTFGPDPADAADAASSSSSSSPGAPVTYTATPNDGTPDGAKLALMNDLMLSLPGGATTIMWLDGRAPEVQHHDPTTPADDLVTLTGTPPATTPALAAVVASAIHKDE